MTIQVRNLTLWFTVASGYTLLRKPTRDFNYMFLLNGSVMLVERLCATVQQAETSVGCALWLFCLELCGG